MKKELYLAQLAQHIRSLPEPERREILADYEAHFVEGMSSGKSEEQIAATLGSPKHVGQEFMMNTLTKQIDQSGPSLTKMISAVGHVLLMILVLAPFNFFMLICPFLILFCLVIAGWALPIALGGVAIGALGWFFQGTGEAVGLMSGLSLFFMFLGTLGLRPSARYLWDW